MSTAPLAFIRGRWLEAREVRYQIVDKPPIAHHKHFRLCSIPVAHDAEAVSIRLVGHDLVEPDSEALSRPVEIYVLGGNAQKSVSLLTVLFPLMNAAANCAGPVVQSTGYANADSLRGPSAFASGLCLDIIHSVKDPDQFSDFRRLKGCPKTFCRSGTNPSVNSLMVADLTILW